jgi:hypothetical protein
MNFKKALVREFYSRTHRHHMDILVLLLFPLALVREFYSRTHGGRMDAVVLPLLFL